MAGLQLGRLAVVEAAAVQVVASDEEVHARKPTRSPSLVAGEAGLDVAGARRARGHAQAFEHARFARQQA